MDKWERYLPLSQSLKKLPFDSGELQMKLKIQDVIEIIMTTAWDDMLEKKPLSRYFFFIKQAEEDAFCWNEISIQCK